jgi:hypothetical protein
MNMVPYMRVWLASAFVVLFDYRQNIPPFLFVCEDLFMQKDSTRDEWEATKMRLSQI